VKMLAEIPVVKFRRGVLITIYFTKMIPKSLMYGKNAVYKPLWMQ